MISHREPEPWFKFYSDLAKLIATRSKDPNKQVGAIIIDSIERRVLGMGYNGPPAAFNDNQICWTKPDKYNYILHAEINAIYDAIDKVGKNRLIDSIIVTTLLPCPQCLLHLITCQIKSCWFLSAKSSMLNEYTQDILDQLASEASFEFNYIGDEL